MIEIVVVDDAPFVIDVVKQLVRDTDIKIVGEASDGSEAIDVIRKLQPDVILMDIVMPIKSGLEAARAILSEQPESKIIITSTIKKNNMVVMALDSGCCEYLIKPFEQEALIAAIRSAHTKTGSQ